VGTDALGLERGHPCGRPSNETFNDRINAEPRQALTPHVQKHWGFRGAIQTIIEEFAEDLRGMVPQGAKTRPSSFPQDANGGGAAKIQRASRKVRRFVRAGAGVVQKQEPRVVALAQSLPAIGGRQQSVDFGFLQIGHCRVVHAPQGHGLELTRTLHQFRDVAADEPEERVDHGHALIQRRVWGAQIAGFREAVTVEPDAGA
jgi:hypothetical protein